MTRIRENDDDWQIRVTRKILVAVFLMCIDMWGLRRTLRGVKRNSSSGVWPHQGRRGGGDGEWGELKGVGGGLCTTEREIQMSKNKKRGDGKIA